MSVLGFQWSERRLLGRGNIILRHRKVSVVLVCRSSRHVTICRGLLAVLRRFGVDRVIHIGRQICWVAMRDSFSGGIVRDWNGFRTLVLPRLAVRLFIGIAGVVAVFIIVGFMMIQG